MMINKPILKDDMVLALTSAEGYVNKVLTEDYPMLADTIEALEVNTEDDMTTAGDYRKKVNDFIKAVEENRKAKVDPFNKVVKDINAAYKHITPLFESCLAKLDAKIKPYMIKAAAEKLARAEAARKAELERMAAKSEAFLKAAEETGNNDILDIAVGIDTERQVIAGQEVKVRKAIKGDEAQTQLRAVYSYNVTDIDSVPRKYLMVDDKAIKAAIQANKDAIDKGSYTIAGLQFVKDFTIASKGV